MTLWIPKDINRHDIDPVLTHGFAFICALAFLMTLIIGPEETYSLFAVIPQKFLGLEDSSSFFPEWLTPLSASILHADPVHILFNMLYWVVFADNIEYAFGKLRFIFFCIASAYLTFLLQSLLIPDSATSIIGASGVLAACLGAYLVLYPKVDVIFTPVFSLFFYDDLRWPVWIVIPWFFLPDFIWLFWGDWRAEHGIAFGAHITGFVFGMAVAKLLRINYGYYELNLKRKVLGRGTPIRTRTDDILNKDYNKKSSS